MKTGHVLGAGAILVALVVLGAHLAGGKEPSEVLLEMGEAECHYLNGSQRVRYVQRYIHNREQYAHFDSNVGLHVPNAPLGELQAKHYNSQPQFMEQRRAEVDMFCRHNYKVLTPFLTERKVQPKVRVTPMQSSSLPQTKRLACYVTGFYPAEIEVKWFQNGREETESVASTDVIQNGDWTYQVLVMLETTPQRGDTYTCQVEHVSLQQPVSQRWELQSDGARSKMLTGVGGFVLGLIFLVLGLGLYVRKKVSGGAAEQGRPGAPPAPPLTSSPCVSGRPVPRAAGTVCVPLPCSFVPAWAGVAPVLGGSGSSGTVSPAGARAEPWGRTVPRPGGHPLFSPQGS
uniref:Ig-like domain-containing protein n=1 Tax=Otus sunia TaxID=257818 RepID=A0A8C8E5B1_9STRI